MTDLFVVIVSIILKMNEHVIEPQRFLCRYCNNFKSYSKTYLNYLPKELHTRALLSV